ncbi:MAG: 3-oxoacyl-ACP reductase family protein [Chloroflexota bacterium]|nr:3-oxoacyl-ACP reductase family protein [Chloroflexota bacterium]
MPDNLPLKDKIALVTGSGRNIGKATAIRLASKGASVVINSRSNEKEASSVRDEILKNGGKAISVIADVGSESEVDSLFTEIENVMGSVTILVNNAGLREESLTRDMTTEEWRRVLSVNLDGPFYCCRAAIPGMLREGWGRIINVSGLNAFKGKSGWGHVSASKMGALGLTRALSLELADNNIMVNHIVPGAFDTSRDTSTPIASNGIPVGRLGIPTEIASAVDFLVSPENGFITGQTLHINGGALAY